MKKFRSFSTVAAIGFSLTLLTACVDPEEEDRKKQASLEAMSCVQLSAQTAVLRERIKSETEKATISAVASAFSTGTTSDVNSINSSLSQITRKNLEKELSQVQILMARKACV